MGGLDTDGELLPAVSELIESGVDPHHLLERLAETRDAVRGAYRDVVEAGTIGALR